MDAVWKHSEATGNALLALLAISDNANDDGFAFPSYEHVASKIRMSKRQTQRIVSKLLDTDELSLVTSGSFGQSNVYAVQVATLLSKPRQFGASDGQQAATSSDGHSDASQVDIRGGHHVSTEPSVSQPSSSEPSGKDIGASESPALFETEAKPSSPSPAPADATNDDLVRRVWDHYVEVFGTDHMRIKELTPARATSIRKAIKATDVPSCCAAIDGLKSYRTKNPGGSRDVSLGSIFETRPGGRNLTDQVEFWASQADVRMNASSSGVPLDLSGVSPVLRGQINARRMDVVRYHSAENPDTQRRIAEAIAWLREHAGHEPVIEDGDLKGWRFVVAD